MPIEVRKIPFDGVTDVAGFGRIIDEGVFRTDQIVAIFGKTEGNGGSHHIKAAVSGVAAAVTGEPAVFVSVAARQQGPQAAGRSPRSWTTATAEARNSRS